MLDFYTIEDYQPKPSNIAQAGLEFAGGLDEQTFSNLQSKGIIDSRFDCYTDFRLGAELIKQIRENILDRQLQSDIDVKKLIQILDTATGKKCGLIAYGD